MTNTRTVTLPGSKPSWVTVRSLPESLAQYAVDIYDILFGLRPAERGKVVLQGEIKDSPRWHQSYLKTPEYSDVFEKQSYMFGNEMTKGNVPLPVEFEPFLQYMNEGLSIPFNQVVVNWYADGIDYTPLHADCETGMVPDAEIAALTLGDSNRPFVMRNKTAGSYFKLVEMCPHGTILTMFGSTQAEFRHGVPQQSECERSRISVTFRKFV